MKKLIIFFMFIMSSNIFAEKIELYYFYYTNKLYHSTLKTEIIPKDCIFINEYSNNNTYKYIYDFKKKEKKLFYKYVNDEGSYYYDFNNNMYENFTDENMSKNSMYKVTKNRFGESLYDRVIYENGNYYEYDFSIMDNSLKQRIYFYRSDDYNTNYINKAYKYSLTQDEIINKNSAGIYLLKDTENNNYVYKKITSILCFQNEYYYGINDVNVDEKKLKNYNNNGNIQLLIYNPQFYYTSTIAQYIDSKDSFLNLLVPKGWYTNTDTYYLNEDEYKITNYLDVKSKQIIKKDYNTVTNDYLKSVISKSKSTKTYIYLKNFYNKEDMENNVNKYKDTELIGFIPLEIFEYYLQ